MFSDVKDYSSIQSDVLYGQLNDAMRRFGAAYLEAPEVLYKNTWGDSLVVVSSTATSLLDIAFQLNSMFRDTNWTAKGFHFALKLRIGLHLEQATIQRHQGVVVDVSGTEINTAARIEPIVEPGQIFCSELFYFHVKGKCARNVRFTALGERPLAKNAGTMPLYAVTKSARSVSETVAPQSIPTVRVRKEFSDRDKDEYLTSTFIQLCDKFLSLSKDLSNQDKDVEIKHSKPASDMLCVTYYIQGNRKTGAKIWLGTGMNYGIHFSHNEDPSDNSMNESVHVSTDGYALGLEPIGFLLTSRDKKIMNPEDLANYFWKAVIRYLQ